EKCRILSEYLNKTLVLNGDAADINFLKDENIENTDMLVSVTGTDELNILTSILGKKLGVSKTIVEVNKPDYEVLMQTLEIDSFITPRLLVAGRLSKLFRKSSIISETFLKDGRAEIIELKVSQDSPLIHQQLKNLRLSAKGIIVGGILRREKAIIPRGDDHILPGDHLIVFTQPQHVKLVERLLCSDKPVVSYKEMGSR
ncbi:MAG TPA: Trk system potassium transporter TrkA, partial [Thermoanaerobacterales bacterium]|nr:Trk system potassium transporter TrkA [Thermoanaerobacterales bacterium]